MLGCYRWLALALALSTSFGCQLNRRAKWRPPVVASPLKTKSGAELAPVEVLYARALEREANNDECCVDDFFEAAAMAWPDVQRCVLEDGKAHGRTAEVYHSSLSKLISAGTHFGRLDPKRGLSVRIAGGCVTIPTNYHGFIRQPEDFDHLVVAGNYTAKDLNQTYRYCGLGVGAVAIHGRRPDETFRRQQQVFAATVVLRSRASGPLAESFVLDMFDPFRVSSMTTAGTKVALKRDLSAPIAYVLSNANRQYLSGFFQPGTTPEDSGLFMIEPFQPDKIPVVFVHGLLSDPYTWANIANELLARPEILKRYQIWGFEYDTGEPFLTSAAMLRKQLLEAQMQVDPTNSDATLSRVVLIGHSMGGLVSKLQVTHSNNQLWDAVSCSPFPNIVTTPETRNLLAEAFFFRPSQMVSRVVFMGTPHRGSPWAQRPIGQLASKLVREPEESQSRHQQLIRDNPDTFSREFSQRIPTSIDLLEPKSPLLGAIDRLPHDGRVQFHTILGRGYCLLGGGNSDRVVPVTSARHADVVTEKAIKSKHSNLHQSPEGVAEIICILRRHMEEFDAELSSQERHEVSWADESLIFRRKSTVIGQRHHALQGFGVRHATTPLGEESGGVQIQLQ
jgi:pimeloyl-ACP methyl ester carboxylesterase